MREFSLAHITDQDLIRELKSLVARDRLLTAAMLAHLAEVDARKLYLPAAHPSMHSYCVLELGMSEEIAFRRIRAARTGRRFPGIFEAVADGRLSLTAIILLAPHLTDENAVELLASAAGKSKLQIEQLLASCFPRLELTTGIQPAPQAQVTDSPSSTAANSCQLAPAPVSSSH